MMITYTQEELSSIVHAFAFRERLQIGHRTGTAISTIRFWCAPPKTASSTNRFCSA